VARPMVLDFANTFQTQAVIPQGPAFSQEMFGPLNVKTDPYGIKDAGMRIVETAIINRMGH